MVRLLLLTSLVFLDLACRSLSDGQRQDFPAEESYSASWKYEDLDFTKQSDDQLYNPGMIKWQDKLFIAVRKDQNKFNWSLDAKEQQQSNFLIGMLDKDHSLIGKLFEYAGSKDFPNLGAHAEDPRLFSYRDKLFALFNATENGNLYGRRQMYIVEVLLEGDKISYGQTRKVIYSKARDLEKNWTPIASGNELYLVYHFEPLQILSLDFKEDSKEINVKDESISYNFPSWRWGRISGGTPFVETEDKSKLISFFHSWRYETVNSKKTKKYYMGSIELKNSFPFEFVRKSETPLIHENFPTEPHHNMLVVFPAGLYREGSDYKLSVGINDVSSSLYTIPYKDIEASYKEQPKSLKIRYINLHSQGLRNDMEIMRRHTDLYMDAITEDKNPDEQVEVNVFLERVKPEFLAKARQNWVLINQEFVESPELYSGIDVVLVKTKRARQLLEAFKDDNDLDFTVQYSGFSSIRPENNLKPVALRENRFWHGAQKSPYKNTRAVLEAWRDHKELPTLNASCFELGDPAWSCYGMHNIASMKWNTNNLHLFKEPLSDSAFQDYFTNSRYIIAASSIEGWGHYLMEALGMGSIVITTDAPPMNEFVTDGKNGFLVHPYKTIPARTGGTAGEVEHLIAKEDLVSVVKKVLALSDDQRKKVSEEAAHSFSYFNQVFTREMRRILTEYFLSHNAGPK